MSEEIKKILIFRTEHIGDYGLSLPALKTIREKFPRAKITIVVGKCNKDFAEATPYVDRVVIWENPLVKRHIGYKGILKVLFKESFGIFKFAQKMNKEKYDMLISFSDRKFNRIFLKLFNPKIKISGHHWPNKGIDDRLRILNLMQKYDICTKFQEVKLNYSVSDKNTVDNFIKKYKLQDKKIILIHTITPLSEKNWELKNWVSLIEKIKEFDKKTTFLLIGAKEENEILGDFIAKNLTDSINVAGLFSVTQLIYLIGKSDLIIGSDSGPVHWAELTKTPIISLFGPTNEKMWGTPKDKGVTIKKDSMEDISIDEVFCEVKKRLI